MHRIMLPPYRAEVFSLSVSCPHRDPCTNQHCCPMDAAFRREMPLRERWRWVNGLSEDEARDLLRRHRECHRRNGARSAASARQPVTTRVFSLAG